MPYKLVKSGKGWKVRNKHSGKTYSKKALPRARALAQMRALYANTDEGFEARLDCILAEMDLSRRGFMKGVAGAAASAALPGVSPVKAVAPIVKAAVPVAAASPIPFALRIFTGTHYGRGDVPDLSEQFGRVTEAFNLTKGLLGNYRVKSWADEDYGFGGIFGKKHLAQVLANAKQLGIDVAATGPLITIGPSMSSGMKATSSISLRVMKLSFPCSSWFCIGESALGNPYLEPVHCV